jgi:hypothetical protein
MTIKTTHLNSLLSEPLSVGDPDVAGPLAVFPVFGPASHLKYRSFTRGRTDGLRLGELESGASVNDVDVQNRTDTSVLLYEGEEVLGAQQNRTFDVSVLVAAQGRVRVPVSCVEMGRWDGSRHGEAMAPSPQAAYPHLRHLKNQHARERVMAGMEARAEQPAVWSEIDRKSAHMGVDSPTGAMHDVYESRRDRLGELTGAVRRREGQLGALVAIGGQFVVLDFVGRDDVFADLFGPLAQGYALDALDTEARVSDGAGPPSVEDARGFVSLALGVEATASRSIGQGEDLRFAADGVAGSGLATDGELVQLTAFPESGAGSEAGPGTVGHIRRPSRRRV